MLVADACGLLNLVATGRLEEILGTYCGNVLTAQVVVEREVIYVLRGGTGEDALEKVPIDLMEYVNSGLLQLIELSDEEIATMVDLSARGLDDGEAAVCAAAVHRGFRVLTDDKAARKHLDVAGVTAIGTCEFLRNWAQESGCEGENLRQLLINVHTKGNFLPPKADALRTWFFTEAGLCE